MIVTIFYLQKVVCVEGLPKSPTSEEFNLFFFFFSGLEQLIVTVSQTFDGRVLQTLNSRLLRTFNRRILHLFNGRVFTNI